MTKPPPSHSVRLALAAGALLAGAPSLLAQAVPAPAPPPESEVIALSPFEVRTDNRGYYASNSMSGTRFNTNLQDLAAPVSVMTIEQMRDFEMRDINDIFLYSTNTEGTGTYSDFSIDRNGQLQDNVQMSPNTANRVRGIASANVSYGNFETSTRMPIDRLIIDGVEISRGPNANVFGLGQPSGTVNQIPALARINRDHVRAELRWDSYDGHRASIDVNRVLLPEKLALRVSAMTEEEGFVRKPSGLDNKRYNGFVRYQPFKNTIINGAVLYYKSEGNRPNFTPPRDYVSYWVEQGRPRWNPVTQSVRVGDTVYNHAAVIAAGSAGGTRTDAFINQVGQPWNAFNRTGAQFQRSNVFITPDGSQYWTTSANNTGSTPLANTGTGVNFIRLMGSSPGPNGASGKFANQPLFNSVPSVANRDIYDYLDINLAAPNRISDEVKTYYATLDQFFINTDRQMLAAQLGFFREEAERYRETPIGDAGGAGGVNGQLWVDVNETNLDGTPNPYVGYTYIGVSEPTYSYVPLKWDTSRAQLAYKYDFTPNDGFSRWFGTHTFSPYYEYKYRVQRTYTFRDVMASEHSWLATGQPGVPTSAWGRANQSNNPGGLLASPNPTRVFQRYYVGDADGTNVDWAPGRMTLGSLPFRWGTTGNWRAEPALLDRLATTDRTGGNFNLKTTIKTQGLVWQSHWLNSLLVTTFGWREDETYSKQGALTQGLSADQRAHDWELWNRWENRDYRLGKGKTKTAGLVARPFRDLPFVNRWAMNGSGAQRFFGALLRDSSVYYNKSDNFIPAPPAIDLFRNELPNQTGEGEDFGAWFNLFEGKLVIRVNRYENKQLNARDGDANTIAQRVLRLDLDTTGDQHRLYRRATDWWRLTNPTWTTAQVQTKVFEQMQMSAEEYTTLEEAFRAGTIAAINDVTAKGTEFEINYNPTPYWTISANGEEKQSINSNVSGTVQEWIDRRMPVWTSIVDQNYDPLLADETGSAQSRGWVADASNPNHLWWIHAYGTSTQTPAQNLAVNVLGPYSIIRQQENKSRPQVRRHAARLSTNLKLAGITDQTTLRKISVGGALRWEDKGSIGYYGRETFPAVITQLNPDRPIWDDDRLYVDANVSYRTRLWDDRVAATFRLNVRNIQEGGRLQATGAFPNGEVHSYRIVDPRQFIVSAEFEF